MTQVKWIISPNTQQVLNRCYLVSIFVTTITTTAVYESVQTALTGYHSWSLIQEKCTFSWFCRVEVQNKELACLISFGLSLWCLEGHLLTRSSHDLSFMYLFMPLTFPLYVQISAFFKKRFINVFI